MKNAYRTPANSVELRGNRNSTRICLVSGFLLVMLCFSYATAGAPLQEEDKSALLSKVRSLQIPFIETRGQVEDGSRGQRDEVLCKDLRRDGFYHIDPLLASALNEMQVEVNEKNPGLMQSLEGKEA